MKKRMACILSIFLCLSLSGCYTVIKYPLLETEGRPEECFREGYYPRPDYYWGFYADCYWGYDRWGYFYDRPWWYEPDWWYHEKENGGQRTWDKFGRRREFAPPGYEGNFERPSRPEPEEKLKKEQGEESKEQAAKKPTRRRQK
jgi:hypothetical protein